MSTEYRPHPLASFLYESAVVLFVLALLVGLLKSGSVPTAEQLPSPPGSFPLFRLDQGQSVQVGDRFPLYQFARNNADRIGLAEVVEVRPGSFEAQVSQLRLPLPVLGEVTQVDPGLVRVSLNRSQVQPGQPLVVFRGKEPLGEITVREVWSSYSLAVPIEGPWPSMIQAGDRVSSKRLPVVALLERKSGFIGWEALVIGAGLAGWLGLAWWNKASPFRLIGEAWRRVKPVFDVPWVAVAVQSALALAALRWLSLITLKVIARFTGWPLVSVFDPVWIGLFLVLAGASFFAKTPPLTLLLRLFEYRGWTAKVEPPPFRLAVIWLCQAVIVAAFASALFSFITANLNASLALAWPDATARVAPAEGLFTWSGFSAWAASLGPVAGAMVSSLPRPAEFSHGLMAFNYIVFTLAILGCLVGYGHSLLSVLWGKSARAVDFTCGGWLVNAWCYGPLLGWAVWTSLPPLYGSKPLFDSGLFAVFVGLLGVGLNLLYTATIWNLGAMFGVMTDKGVRTTWFYSVVRHPSYTLEVFLFVILEMKGLTGVPAWLAASAYFFLYWLRSERDDHFMSRSNPDYEEYKKAVPYKFIPHVV